MVKEIDISLSKDSINAYLGNPLTFPEGELDEFLKHLARGNWDINLVADTLALEGGSYETNVMWAPKKFLTKNLTTMAQVFMTLVLYNIRSKSHTSSIPLDTAYLLYYIIDEKRVDVARVISNEMKMIALKEFFGRSVENTFIEDVEDKSGEDKDVEGVNAGQVRW
ncbi:hypothetical protein RYX36_010713 [Vicia faba]